MEFSFSWNAIPVISTYDLETSSFSTDQKPLSLNTQSIAQNKLCQLKDHQFVFWVFFIDNVKINQHPASGTNSYNNLSTVKNINLLEKNKCFFDESLYLIN